MIKVLNVISDTNVGGAGRVILNYLKYYDRDKYEISVVLPKNSQLKERILELGAPVYEVDAMADKSLDMKAIGLLKAVIKRVDPDIVHTHGSMSGRIAARQCGKIVIYTRHSAFPVSPKIKKGIGRFVNKTVNEHYADRIIAVSNAAKENLTDGGIDERLIDVMMNGVDPVKRADDAACAEYKKTWGIEDDDFVLGILARVEDYKGHMNILEAVKILTSEGRKVKLMVAGDGTFLPEVKAKAEELGINDRVAFMGFVTDVAGVLSVLDLQLNASYGTETSSLSVLEGFSMGLPSVVSDYGGNPWLVDHGINGYIFKTKDSTALAVCIRDLMDSPETLKAMQEGALRIYKERFTGEIFAANIERVYEKTLKEAGK